MGEPSIYPVGAADGNLASSANGYSALEPPGVDLVVVPTTRQNVAEPHAIASL
jgi:hypothetical protein